MALDVERLLHASRPKLPFQEQCVTKMKRLTGVGGKIDRSSRERNAKYRAAFDLYGLDDESLDLAGFNVRCHVSMFPYTPQRTHVACHPADA